MSEPGTVERFCHHWLHSTGFVTSDLLAKAREHDAADARLAEENAALRIGLLVAHEYCCDDFEVLCRPDNCQIQQALTGDARILDRENRDSSLAAISLLKRDLARREALLRALADIFEGHAGDGCSILNEVDDAA